MAKVNFNIEDPINDLITEINGQALPAPILAGDWSLANLGDYWVEKSLRGDLALCTELPDFIGQTLTMQRINQSIYYAGAVDFVGGRPDVRR